MKAFVILTILLMMSCISTSQTLVPEALLIKDKEYFCFNMKQSRELAKLLELGVYNDSLVNAFTHSRERFQELVAKKQAIIDFQENQLENYKLVSFQHNKVVGLLEERLQRKERKIKRGKFHKLLLGASLIITATIVLIK